MSSRRFAKLFATIALAAVVLAPAGNAANITIFDNRPDETIRVVGGDFEGCLTILASTACGLGTPSVVDITVPEGGPITFSGRWIDLGLVVPSFHRVFFVEPGSLTLISDILVYQTGRDESGMATIFGSFISDGEQPLGQVPLQLGPGESIFNEADGFYDFSQHFLSARAISDTEEAAVPEPASLLLLGTGLSALATRLRRKRAA